MKNCIAEQRKKTVVIFTAILCVILVNTLSYANYTDIGNGIIVDKNHSLLWQQADDGVIRNYYEAWQYCNELNAGGNNDWILPSKLTLSTLVDLNFTPTINPMFSARHSDYLTSDLRSILCMDSGYSGLPPLYSSYIINFNDGSVSSQPTTSVCGQDAIIGYVRCASNYKPSTFSLSHIIKNFLLKSDTP